MAIPTLNLNGSTTTVYTSGKGKEYIQLASNIVTGADGRRYKLYTSDAWTTITGADGQTHSVKNTVIRLALIEEAPVKDVTEQVKKAAPVPTKKTYSTEGKVAAKKNLEPDADGGEMEKFFAMLKAAKAAGVI